MEILINCALNVVCKTNIKNSDSPDKFNTDYMFFFIIIIFLIIKPTRCTNF